MQVTTNYRQWLSHPTAPHSLPPFSTRLIIVPADSLNETSGAFSTILSITAPVQALVEKLKTNLRTHMSSLEIALDMVSV